MVTELDNYGALRLQRGGKGGRKETIYKGTFENIMESHSSVVIIQVYPEAISHIELKVGSL